MSVSTNHPFRVAFVTHENYHMPGARVRCYCMAKALAERGADARVFSFHDEFGRAYAQMSDTEMMLNSLRAYNRLVKEPAGTILFVQRINYHTLAPFLASRVRGFPLVLDCDDWDFDAPIYHTLRQLPGFDAHTWLDRVGRTAAACVASSHALKDVLEKLNGHVEYLPTGVDTVRFHPPTAEEDAAARSRPVTVSWIGTVFRRDNVLALQFAIRVFAEVFRRWPHCRLEIASTGFMIEEIKRQVADRYPHVDITFVPWMAPDEVPGYLRRIDVGLLPLIPANRFNQSKSPTKLFEYMACRLATISSRVGEAAHVVRDGIDGFLADDEAGFVEALLTLVRDDGRRRAMGEAARKRVEERFSHELMADQLYNWLYDISGRGAHPKNRG